MLRVIKETLTNTCTCSNNSNNCLFYKATSCLFIFIKCIHVHCTHYCCYSFAAVFGQCVWNRWNDKSILCDLHWWGLQIVSNHFLQVKVKCMYCGYKYMYCKLNILEDKLYKNKSTRWTNTGTKPFSFLKACTNGGVKFLAIVEWIALQLC